MDTKKMTNRANSLYVFSKVCGKITLAAVIVLAIFALLVLLVKDEGFVTNASVLQFGRLELELAEQALPAASIQRGRISIGLCAVALLCGFLSYGFHVAAGIFAAIKEGRPFEGVVSKGFKTLGILTLAGGLLYQLVDGIASFLLIKSYALMDLFKDDLVRAVRVNVRLELGFLIIALVLMLMSDIFRYGEELQRESDETL